MRFLLPCALCLAVLAAGCQPSVETAKYPLPAELQDCKLFKLSDGLNSITVVRCPNSTTSTNYREGKSDRTSVVVDGGAEPSGNAGYTTRDALPSQVRK